MRSEPPPLTEKSQITDVVIPVYNAKKYTEECLRTVSKHTHIDHRLIIIDDHSTEDGLVPALEKYCSSYSRQCSYSRNDSNLGFVKTVNKAMRMSRSNDVILLNTDTLVTKNWAQKMRTAAYSSDDIATVTPLSNNGNSICSVPVFGQVNDIPEGHTVDSFGELVEQMSGRLYPDIPTAVGFCMYIKRSALDEVGLFDEKTFGKGYGEETDFALRAGISGYRNVLDDSTYIFHRGGASFEFTKTPTKQRQKDSLEILKSRYPNFLPSWETFMEDNPLAPIHRRIWFGLNNYEQNPLLFRMKLALFQLKWSLERRNGR